MATKIRLMRLGKIREPYYRIVVTDSRTKRDGRAIEVLGKYHPKREPSYIEVDSERVQYWLSVGAQPTEPVRSILSVTGDWQRFKGLPAPEPMRSPVARTDKQAIYEAAAKTAQAEQEAGAKAERRPRARKAAAEETVAAEQPTAEEPTAEEPTAEEPTTATPAAEAAAEPAEQAAETTAEPTAEAVEPAAAETQTEASSEQAE